VVSACGFDSIPNDMGVLFTIKSFPDNVIPSSINSFISIQSGTSMSSSSTPSHRGV
jgi:short subunit dehydrogenase-like uncharacterized protein